ncbi:acylneuraminate cytidylyltransferase family protein [Nocardioides panacisoli]|uniref:acylneuraminate cytidylyltransferase family protein n=1 Tax=Nocardioides panacisoli TaxID=627624 RepID=UPI001C63B16E|nr:acylneuraminate cytidylyltransferase family protein [Nocardioides panacisoli]QYJ03731.1 acylneuraminate cytidylyltransferase family protein [Nocardioides panacisoli]
MLDSPEAKGRGGAPFVAVVPLRAGSKGLPGKNVRELAGRPLYRHAVEHARDAGATRIVITTDVPEVLSADHGQDVVLHHRPDALASDTATMDDVLGDVLARGEFDDVDVVLLQPTSPLRRVAQVRGAIDLFRAGAWELVMSVCEADRGVLKYGTIEDDRFRPLRSAEHPFQNRQSLPRVHRPNGAIYVFAAEWFRHRGSLATDSIGAFEMPSADSWDIDNAADFDECERVLNARRRTEQ